jgi:uncharacterized alpha-E superfamily protein
MMLPRVAGALFDIGCEIERMDHGARVLEVVHGMSLGMGEQNGVVTRLNRVAPRSMESVAKSAAIARERADTVRGHLPAELWEAVNEANLDLRDALEDPFAAKGVYGLSLCARRAGHLVFGVADQAMRRDGLWHYLCLGRFLERASATTRLLAAAEEAWAAGEPADERGWRAVLEATSAYHAFLRSNTAALDHASTVRFLVLDGEFPRSVVFALTEVAMALDGLVPKGTPAPARAASEATGTLLSLLTTAPPRDPGDLIHLTLDHLRLIEAAIAVDCLPRVFDDPGGLHDAQAAHQTQN